MTRFSRHIRICMLLPFVIAGLAVLPVLADQKPAPAKLSEQEAKAFKSICRSFATSFLEKDEGSIRAMCISKQQIADVLSPKLIERAGGKMHQVIVDGNTRAFVTLRQKLGNLEGFKFVRAEHGYRLKKSQWYPDPKPVLKNSYVVLADGNRLIVKIKLEELVFIDGKYHLVKLD